MEATSITPKDVEHRRNRYAEEQQQKRIIENPLHHGDALNPSDDPVGTGSVVDMKVPPIPRIAIIVIEAARP